MSRKEPQFKSIFECPNAQVTYSSDVRLDIQRVADLYDPDFTEMSQGPECLRIDLHVWVSLFGDVTGNYMIDYREIATSEKAVSTVMRAGFAPVISLDPKTKSLVTKSMKNLVFGVVIHFQTTNLTSLVDFRLRCSPSAVERSGQGSPVLYKGEVLGSALGRFDKPDALRVVKNVELPTTRGATIHDYHGSEGHLAKRVNIVLRDSGRAKDHPDYYRDERLYSLAGRRWKNILHPHGLIVGHPSNEDM